MHKLNQTQGKLNLPKIGELNRTSDLSSQLKVILNGIDTFRENETGENAQSREASTHKAQTVMGASLEDIEDNYRESEYFSPVKIHSHRKAEA